MEDLKFWMSLCISPVVALIVGLGAARMSRSVVLKQIRADNERLKQTFENDAQAKAVERRMDMKRQSFLQVTEGLAVASQYLASFSDTETPRSEHFKNLSKDASRLYAVNLIGNDRTIRALTNVQEKFVQLVMELESARFEKGIINGHIELAEKRLERNVGEEALLRERLCVEGAGAEQIRTILENLRKERAKLEENLDALRPLAFKGKLSLAKQAIRASVDLENCGIEAVLAMRDELGLPIDAEGYEKFVKESRQRTVAWTDELMKNLETRVLGARP